MVNSSKDHYQSQFDIAIVCDEIKELLLKKNLSRIETAEQLNSATDHKDPEWELLGTLILKRVEKMQRERRSQ